VVIGDEAILSKEGLRFQDEFARHKILDLIGDLYLLGIRLQGHLIAMKSGHALNIKFANVLRSRYEDPHAAGTRQSEPVSMSLEEIKKLLPHRYPFLLVDKITSVQDNEAVGIKNVTNNEYYFKGHFPKQALMPGVLQIEAMAQVAGASMMRIYDVNAKGKRPVLVGVDRVKFRKPVIPGDQMVIHVTWGKVKKNLGKAFGIVRVNNQVVSEAEVTFTLVDEKLQ